MPHPLQLQQLPSTLLRDRRADRGWATVKDVRKIVFTEGHCFPLLSDSPQVLTASVGVNRILRSQLVAVSPGDPLTLFAASALLVLFAAFGCYVPGRRATAIDPAEVLRHE